MLPSVIASGAHAISRPLTPHSRVIPLASPCRSAIVAGAKEKTRAGGRMSPVVRYERRGAVGIVTVDNPPVNALSQAVRQGLIDALAQGLGDDGAQALIVIGAGRTFIAGADIKEFGKPLAAPDLNLVISTIE